LATPFFPVFRCTAPTDNDFKQEWCRRRKQKEILAQKNGGDAFPKKIFIVERPSRPAGHDPLLGPAKCCPVRHLANAI
jgi:hypothetical protein